MAQGQGTQLKCPRCGATFDSQSKLQQHQQQCNERK